MCLKSENHMKKLIYLFSAATMTFVISCGPSAEEKAAEEKRIADSIAAATEARIQDSLALVAAAVQDSLAAVQKAAEDSLREVAIADSIAAAKKKSTPKPQPKKSPEQQKIEKQIKEVKDATRGRG